MHTIKDFYSFLDETEANKTAVSITDLMVVVECPSRSWKCPWCTGRFSRRRKLQSTRFQRWQSRCLSSPVTSSHRSTVISISPLSTVIIGYCTTSLIRSEFSSSSLSFSLFRNRNTLGQCSMGVHHGGRGDGEDKSPPRSWSGGIVPPDFVMLQNFKHQITCITMYENVFFASTAGLL